MVTSLSKLFTGPYAMVAKIGAGVLAFSLLAGALLWWGHTKYQAGVRDTDAKWELASTKLKEQAVVSAGKADVKAERRAVEFAETVAEEKEKLDEAERNGSSPLDVLFGPGGV